MKFLSKLFKGSPRKAWATLWIAMFALLAPSIARADILNIGPKVVSGIMYYSTTFIGWIAGFFVVVEVTMLEWLLQFNLGITDQTLVQMGFPIVLSITNLIFVLGIIVVAIATILRIETYGIKNILWKILVVAIAVNFGLVIAGTILRFSDNITMFMVEAINPGKEGAAGIQAFSTSIAGAFNPQKATTVSDAQITGQDSGVMSEAFATTGATFGAMLRPILGAILSIFTYGMILIILGALVVILVARYIAISLLLVVLPISWAAWAFPAYRKRATEWWEKFMKLAFAPIPIVFFLWLALITATTLKEAGVEKVITSGDGAGAAAVGFLGNMMAPLLTNFMNAVLLAGIMGFGLVAAEKMGASFAKNAQNGIKSLQGNMKSQLINRSKRTGARAGAWAREKTAPATARLNKAISTAGLNIKSTGQRVNQFGAMTYGVKAETIHRGEDGKPIMSEVGINADGKQGVWKDKVVVDANGNAYTDYTQNSSGLYIDRKTGKLIEGGSEKGGFVTRDGKVFEQAATRKLAYATQEGTVLTDEDLKNERGGRIAVRDDGKVVDDFLTASGALKANYTNDKNAELAASAAGYAATQASLREAASETYKEASQRAQASARSQREKLWAQAKADDSILYGFTVGPMRNAIGAMSKPAQKAPKKKDVLEAMEKMGLHFEHEHDHGDDHGKGGASKAGGHDTHGGGGEHH